MKKNTGFFKGMFGVLLTFALVWTACESPVQEIKGTVDAPSLEAPEVTAAGIVGGVELKWDPVLGASSYSVWRRTGENPDVRVGSASTPDKDGKIVYRDLVSDDNPIKAGTSYTYTVYAIPETSVLGSGRSEEVSAAPASIPAKGTKLAAPTGVSLSFDEENETITVSWTAGTGVPADSYSVEVSMSGYGNLTSATTSSTSASISWSTQYETTYAAQVTAQVSGSDSYFRDSDPAVSADKVYTVLLDSVATYGPTYYSPVTDADNGITSFVSQINLNGGKSGVVYTVERAPLDAAGKAGTYTPITLSKSSGSNSAVSAADLTADVLGNIPVFTVYDRTVPNAKASYKYRVKAVKGSTTQYKVSDEVEVDPRDFISLSIAIDTRTTAGSNSRYAVTPYLNYKGALQAGDKLVLYYVTSNNYSAYQDGPYTQSIEFSKDDLEAVTVSSKNLNIPDGDSYAYVQAYFVLADDAGTLENVSSLYGNGVSNTSNYWNGSTSAYYAQLNY